MNLPMLTHLILAMKRIMAEVLKMDLIMSY